MHGVVCAAGETSLRRHWKESTILDIKKLQQKVECSHERRALNVTLAETGGCLILYVRCAYKIKRDFMY